MTGTDVARFIHKSVPVIFEPPCNNSLKPNYNYVTPTISLTRTAFYPQNISTCFLMLSYEEEIFP